MDTNSISRLLVAAGAFIVIAGVVVLLLGKLPGDIRVERENFRFYFPITTSIAISIILSVVLYLVSRLR